MLVFSTFFFSHIVFKIAIPWGRQKSPVYGEVLNIFDHPYLISVTEWCEAETIQSDIYGTLSWKPTQLDILAQLPCPYQTSDVIVYASRFWYVTEITRNQ